MGGRLTMRVAHPPGDSAFAARDVRRVAARVNRWASRLTRFTPDSDLAVLNRNAGPSRAAVRPTLGAVLAWSCQARDETNGIVDVALLDARLAAEGSLEDATTTGRAGWWLEPGTRGWLVRRVGYCRFDLDGVAKGWIADRALALLGRYRSAIVDADGDIAMRVSARTDWGIGLEHPDGGPDLAVVRTRAWRAGTSIGIATSGTSVHRWSQPGGRWSHHLIDPRTGRPAATDVTQATVIASSAALAEALAKAAVIQGSTAGLEALQRSNAMGALLVLASGELLTTPQADRWLA
jgi:thiamine biosynthesis lipoprotein